MEKEKSWVQITEIGRFIQKNWREIADKYKIDISIQGIPALSTFTFNHEKNLELKTYLTREFLEKNYLGSTAFYTSIDHTDNVTKKYFEVFDDIMYKISKYLKGDLDFKEILKYPTCHSGFKRLN